MQPDEPHLHSPVRLFSGRDRNAREDTELARLRRNYSRASSYRQQSSSTGSTKPSNLLERFAYAISGFWRHQVSVTVEHSTCRDHLGTFMRILLCRAHILHRESAICVLSNWVSEVRRRSATAPCLSFVNSCILDRCQGHVFNSFIKRAEARAGMRSVSRSLRPQPSSHAIHCNK